MKHYGFIKDEYDSKDFVLGSSPLPREPLQKDGQWTDYLPEYEPQFADGWDTYGCTIFGTLNALEILYCRIYGLAPNYSERYHYNAIPVRPPGGTPNNIAESIRKRGVINQANLPMTGTFDEYTTPTPITAELLAIGQEWLKDHTFGHEFVWKNEPTKEAKVVLLKEALKYSPVCVSVTAWHEQEDGSYGCLGLPNNHWTTIVGYVEKGGETYFKVFDSYDHNLRILHPDHHIEVAKRYYLDDKYYVDNDIKKKDNWLTQFFKAIVAFIKDLIPQNA